MGSAYLSSLQSPSGIAVSLICLLSVWLLGTTFRSWYRLRHVPGPWFAGLSYMWNGWIAYSGKQHKVFVNLDKKYGSLVRIGPEVLLTSDVELIKRISATKSSYGKSSWVDGVKFNPYHETMFAVRDPKQHDRAKARLAPAYSGRDTPDLEGAVDQQVNNLMALIRRRYLSDPANGVFRTLPLLNILSYFTLDVISRVALGKEFGCCASDSDPYRFYDGLDEHMPLMALTTDVPWIRSIMFSSTFLKYFGPRETDSHGIGPLMKVLGRVTNDNVRQRYGQDQKEKTDMLVCASPKLARGVWNSITNLFLSQSSFKAHGLSEGNAQSETLFMFIAGSDTTASAIRMTLFYLMSCPRVYRKLKDEIRDAIRDGKVSSPITLAQARELPYLQAVIYEGLRMRPVSTGQQAKEIPAGGDTINGSFIPGGTSIAINFSAILGSKALFGPDADVFRPERFLGLSSPELAEMRRNVEMTFGHGRWMCAGKPLAFMELQKVYFELLRAFDFQLTEPLSPMHSESYAVFRDFGLKVRATVAEDMG
ncbi:cytochrome P450 monooxygenase [Fusarium beomiforme]|uniref:Cytochrome P450 monooxygenase n=1 Tax=Fusarium beomiforme TaxID=44412 RepID=A0A9P5E5W8_9HYPO|nr:cytochrome P450 monooxygenase [Fusarium beomiforme]